MIHRCVSVFFALACAIAAPNHANAHPHVWITVIAALLYDKDGSVSGLRQSWTFDEMFSAFATRGIEQKTPGAFTPEELGPLAKTYIDGLKDYGYFVHAKRDGKPDPNVFGEPLDYSAEYDSNASRLTLHFTLPLKTSLSVNSLAIEIYDPQLFFYLSFSRLDPVRLIDAPVQCTASVEKPSDAGAGESAASPVGLVATSTSQVWVKCP